MGDNMLSDPKVMDVEKDGGNTLFSDEKMFFNENVKKKCGKYFWTVRLLAENKNQRH